MPSYFNFEDDPDSDDTHPHVCVEHVMVPMRDGIRLASTVYRPSFGGDVPVPEPLPVVFHRTPYNKDKSARTERCLLPDGTLSEPIENPQTADRFARRGYVVVIQDCRGRYQSEGRFTKYVNEGDDGEDSLEWITSQLWCNGKVGTFGLSYCAHVQLAVACKGAPGLAAMFLESGGFWDAYRDGVRYGGAFTMKQVTWAFKNAKVSPEVTGNAALRAAMEAISLHEWFERVYEWFPGYSPLSLAPDYESYIFHDWAAQYDGEEWQQVGLCARRYLPSMADVPTLIICSWYDPYVGAMSELFNGLTSAKDSEVRMVLGPWTHGDHAITYAGEVDFGPQCTFDRNVAPTFQAARAAWFDEFLHGRPPGASPTPGTSPLPGGTPLRGNSPLPGTSPPAEPISRNFSGLVAVNSLDSLPMPPPRLSATQLLHSLSSLIASRSMAHDSHPTPPLTSANNSSSQQETGVASTAPGHVPIPTVAGVGLDKVVTGIADTHALLLSADASPMSVTTPQPSAFTFAALHGPTSPSVFGHTQVSPVFPAASNLPTSGTTTPPAFSDLQAVLASTRGASQERSSLSNDARKLAFFRPSLEVAVAVATGAPVGNANSAASGNANAMPDGLALERVGRSPGSSTRNSFTGHGPALQTHGRNSMVHPSSHPSASQSILNQVVTLHHHSTVDTTAPIVLPPSTAGAGTALPPLNTQSTLNGALRSNSGVPVLAMGHTTSSVSTKQPPQMFGTSPNVSTPMLGSSPVSRNDIFMSAWGKANGSRGGVSKAAGSITSKTHAGSYVNALPGVQFTPSVSSSAPWHQPMPPVKYFRMGGGPGTRNAAGRLEHGGDWLSCKEWPPAWASHPTVFTLLPEGLLEEDAVSGANDSRIVEEGCETDGAGTLRDEDTPDSSAVVSALPSPSTHRSVNNLPCTDTVTAHTRMTGTSGHHLACTEGQDDNVCVSGSGTASSGSGDVSDTYHSNGVGGLGQRAASLRRVASINGGPVVVLPHDPLAPVPTIGGNITSGEPIMSGGAFDQVERPQFFGCSPEHTGRRMCDHPGVRIWATPTLSCDMELTGVVRCVIAVSSDAPDADIHVTLVDEYPKSDVYPSGFSMNVASGIARARVRHGCLPHEVSWLQLGHPSVVTVELNVVSNLFAKGHRLRLDVSASSFPRYDVNYGVTDEEHSEWARAHGIEEKKARKIASARHINAPPSVQGTPGMGSTAASSNGRSAYGSVGVDEGEGMGGEEETGEGSGEGEQDAGSVDEDGLQGYVPLQYTPVSEGARTALIARKQAAGLWDEGKGNDVKGRPYRVCRHVIHVDGRSYVELPVRKLDGEGGLQGGEGRGAASPTGPLIPFSPIWLQRRPTWSR